MVELKDVRKKFVSGGVENEVLRGVNLKVESGDFLAVVGASGAGKTTLLSIMGTILKPTSGSVFIDGEEVSSLSESELSERIRGGKVGFVFQHGYLINEMNVIENTAMPLLRAGIRYEEAVERAEEVVKKVGLNGKELRYPSELSKGEYQRVALGRAMIFQPQILLADEPTGNLDSKTAMEVMEYTVKFCADNKSSLVIATHNEKVASLAKKILTIKDGILI